MPYYNRDPKRDHNFDNHPYVGFYGVFRCALIQVLPGSLWEFVGLRGAGFIWLDRGFRRLTALECVVGGLGLSFTALEARQHFLALNPNRQTPTLRLSTVTC